ncbi:MAG TPA: DNA repair protein RecO [Polyangia bacterium]|nr:DNA repair protein RecO [Polyangia bacterium]
MAAALSTPAILLRTINYGESDRVVTLFGRSTGRLSALARGARKSQRRFAGGLDLCAVGEASLRERNGAELLTLESFDLRVSYSSFGTDVANMAHAAYVAELVSKLCAPRQVETGVYDWLDEFLGLLDRGGASAERLRVFELGLLGRLGFAPVVDTCAVCNGARVVEPISETGFRWDPDRGGAVCPACGQRGRPIRTVVRATLSRLAATPLGAAAEPALSADVNRGCREAIFEVLKLHITGTLQSLEFIAKLGGRV